MKSLSFITLLAVAVATIGCSSIASRQAQSVVAPKQDQQIAETENAKGTLDGDFKTVALKEAAAAQNAAAAADRKIIKDAELTIEVNSPGEAQRTVSSIAESHGGFVVSSETKQTQTEELTKRAIEVKLIARVPANQFEATLSEVEKLALNVTDRKSSGNDVTEEYIDLEARIRTQKALEVQFLQIMKQAGKISDALEVQRQIADVRTEIEKLEGRKRFLENRATLSTITVNIKPPIVIAVSTTGFGRNLREAISDSVDVASAIVLFLTRFVIVMIPIFVLIILPIGLATMYFVRRARRMRLAEELGVATAGN